MSTLLLHLSGNKSLNRTIFPSELYIYDDLILYKKRRLFSSKEVTISYNQISQVTLSKGIFFARLDVVTTGTEDMFVNFVNKKSAAQAKKIIDQKIYHSHAKHHDDVKGKRSPEAAIEKALSRLQELLQRGHISEKDYNKKRNALLNDL
jgi:hypothetical protein